MPRRYKQLCARCKKTYVLVSWRDRFPTCYECQAPELIGEIDDPDMKVMFDVPEDFYRKSPFLRSIKINYLRSKKLTEKQIAAFKKAVVEMKEE